jgi:superoxide dismutase, Fe-Mn family
MEQECKVANQQKHPFVLPELPFLPDALQPYMSAETFSYHHGKHHKAYVDKLNELVTGTEYASMDLEAIIKSTYNKEDKIAIFNNAAQVWNHSFFWYCLKKSDEEKPSGALLSKITEDFGSFDNFRTEFKNGGISQFGSGWVWLVEDNNGKLKIMKTGNADLPMVHGVRAIICTDVWEHAYYVDYRNARANYLDVFLEKLANWEFASKNYERSL